MMKNISVLLLSLIAIVNSPDAFARSADQVQVMPHTGNLPTWGQVDLSKSAAIKGYAGGACYATSTSSALSFADLPPQWGGTGVNSSASTGIAHVASGSWTFSSVNLSGSDVTGNLPVTNLNSGTNASSVTAFFGDGTWKVPNITQLTPISGSLTTGSTTVGTPLYFVTTGFSATVGAVYSFGGTSCTVSATVSSSSLVNMACPSGVSATSGTATLTSGTGSSTLTYSSYVSPVRLAFTLIGGGGGGGTASNSTQGGTGGTSTFGGSSCSGGIGGAYNVTGGGGSCSAGSGISGVGTVGYTGNAGTGILGGAGGGSGCAGGGGRPAGSGTANLHGSGGSSNTGGGGSGGNSDGTNYGSYGGGGGGCLIAGIYNPSGSYSVAIGSGGAAGGSYGAAGGSGFAYWQFFYY